jgi:hypothetical protein
MGAPIKPCSSASAPAGAHGGATPHPALLRNATFSRKREKGSSSREVAFNAIQQIVTPNGS